MTRLQDRVRRLAGELVADRREPGLQVAAYRDGAPAVDVAAGTADATTGRPVTPETLFYPYSVGKAMTATIVHVLAERGAFGDDEYDAPIARFWPEFAQHGKDGVRCADAHGRRSRPAVGRHAGAVL